MPWSWIRPGSELLALSKEPAYAEIIGAMRSNVAYWEEHFEDASDRTSGWAHNYVCPRCASHLVYDRDKPLEHVCPSCGNPVENTQDILEAWTYYRRQEIVTTLFDAAVLYRMEGNATHRDFILRVIDFYTDIYHEFDEHGTHAGRGRLMNQSLDEAVWGDFVLRALIVLEYDGKSPQGQRWLSKLFRPIARLVMAQSGIIHNIPLWHASFALGTGLFFGDDRLAEQAWKGELGARNQILRGFTEDGIWYENSTSYHYYSLEASTNVCLFGRYAGKVDEEVFDRVINGYVAFLKLGFRGDSMPAFNDGWRSSGEMGIRGRLTMYMSAARLFDGIPGADKIAAAIAEFDTEGTLAEFLFGKTKVSGAREAYGSVNLPHNCMGMLRSDDLEVFVKYGNLHRSHAHPDALQICIPPFTGDMGTPGYGSPFHSGWFTRTLSHCTFVVDGVSQRMDARGTGILSADGTAFDMEISDAYEGVTAHRQLVLHGCVMEDTMRVSCEENRQVDWIYHGTGDFHFDGTAAPAELPGAEESYGYLTNVRRVKGLTTVHYTVDGKTLSLVFEALPIGAAIYVANSPDNPADNLRSTVIIRTTGKESIFKIRFTLQEANQ